MIKKYVKVSRLWLEGDRIGMRWIGAVKGNLRWAAGKWKNDPIIPDVFDTWAFGVSSELRQKNKVLKVVKYPLFEPPIAPESMRSLADKVTFVVVKLGAPEIPIGVMVWYKIDWENKFFWIRKYLDEENRHQNFGREMNVLTQEFAVECMDGFEIRSGVKKTTPRSHWNNCSCGFEVESVTPNHFVVQGKLVDSVLMKFKPEKWLRMRRYLEEHSAVGRVVYERLQNDNAKRGVRMALGLPSCLQIADVLESLSPPYRGTS